MGKVLEAIDSDLKTWIESQRLFFVATAPISTNGLINCSPKGMDTFRITGAREVAYLDLTGSGIETAAHVKENARIVFMFCAFDGPPKIVRLHGKGSYVRAGTTEFSMLQELFPSYRGARGVVRADLDRISDSCGYSVPRYEYVGERDTLLKWADSKSPEELTKYRNEKNAKSLDGLPGIATDD